MKRIFIQVNIGFDLTSGHKIGWSQILDFDHNYVGQLWLLQVDKLWVGQLWLAPRIWRCQDLRFGDTKVSGSSFTLVERHTI